MLLCAISGLGTGSSPPQPWARLAWVSEHVSNWGNGSPPGLPSCWHRVRLRINPCCQGEQGAQGRKYPFPHPGICLLQLGWRTQGRNWSTVLQPD